MRRVGKRGLLGWILWAIPCIGWTQFTPGGVDFPSNVSSQPQGEFDIGPDTLSIFHFFADNPGEEFSFTDSLLGNFFEQYDPARRRILDYVTLGNLGSAARPLFYEPRYRKGFDVGLHAYDLYMTTATDLPYYRIDRAYTNINYFQRAEQADSYLTAKFSRNFANGLNFSVDYKRLSQLGRRNQFPHQNSRNTALATGLWYHSRDGRYDGFFAVAWNTIEQEDNGGLSRPPEETDGFNSPNSAEVFREQAQTRYRHRSIAYTQYYTFGPSDAQPELLPPPPPAPLNLRRSAPDTLNRSLSRPAAGLPDSLAARRPPRDSLTPAAADTSSAAADRPDPNRRRFTLAHQFQYQSNNYLFFDDAVDDEAAAQYYGDFIVDSRGLRFSLQHRMVENSFRLRTFKPGKGGADRSRRQRDLLEVGLLHRLNKLDFETADSTVNNLFLFGRLHFQPGRLRIRTYGQFGLWDHAGDYRAYGELFLDLGKLGQLTLTANNQLYEPTLVQDRLVIGRESIWKNNFKKTLETNLTATFALPNWRFEVSGRYHLLSNVIYFDSLAIPRQTGVPVSVAQLIIQKDFTVGRFHLDNTVGLQTSSEDFIRVPDVFSKQSLYYEGKAFRVMLVRLGFDLRLNSTYAGYYYFPLTGQFINQSGAEVPFYPSVDGFLSMRVTRFRAFLKWENMTALAITDRLFYLQANYAFQSGSGLRFGINWRFVD